MASHINNIRDEWNLNSALDALPGRLSPNHQHDAMAWGEPFLGYLSTLASLTPGNLPEVQDRLNSRIDLGRRFGLGARENWAVQDDLVALIRQYGVALARQEGHSPRAKAQFVKAEEATPVCKSEETSPEYTKENPRRSGRERKPVVGNGSFAGMAEDDSSSAVFTPTRSAKRKRGQNREEDTGAAPVRVKRARRRARRDCSPALSLPDARDVPSAVVEDNGRVQADNDEVQQGQVGVQEEVLAIDEHFPKQEDIDQGHVDAQEEVPVFASYEPFGEDIAPFQFQFQLQEQAQPQQEGQLEDDRKPEPSNPSDPDHLPQVQNWVLNVPSSVQSGPPSIAALSEGVREMSFEHRFPTPANATPQQQVALLRALRRRNESVQFDAELEYRIMLAEIEGGAVQ